MVGAMARMRAALATDCGDVFVALLPQWLWSLDFHHAVVECGRHDDLGGLVHSLHVQLERFRPAGELTRAAAGDASTSSPTLRAATARLVFGELLEAHAAHRAALVCGVNEVPIDPEDRKALARVFFDGYLAAVWTSAHAEFLGVVYDLVGARMPTEKIVQELMVPVPELYSVASLSNLLDVSALYERAASPKCCTKSSHGLLCILARATNAGSRGWESTLHAAAKDSDGAVRVCMQAVGVCFSGLHPCVHPAARRNWRTRFVTLRAWRAQNQTVEFKDMVKRVPGAIKEAVRLHLAAVLDANAATLAAFAHSQQPPGQLVLPPQYLPPNAMIAAMHSFLAAGAELALPAVRESVAALANRHLNSESRSRKKPRTRRTGRAAAAPAAVAPAAAAEAGAPRARAARARPSRTSRTTRRGWAGGPARARRSGPRRPWSTACFPPPSARATCPFGSLRTSTATAPRAWTRSSTPRCTRTTPPFGCARSCRSRSSSACRSWSWRRAARRS